jgi:coenzyme F420 hydrogenase subunit beta
LAKPQLKIWGTLNKEVVNTDLCMFCGTCIAACPVNVLFPTEDEKPTIKGMCVLCELCYYSCPRIELPIDDIEEYLYGRMRNDEEINMGILRETYSVRSSDPKIRMGTQDSGATTSILSHAISKGYIDYAITTGMDEKDYWRPKPYISTNSDDLLKTAKSKYSVGASVSGVGDAITAYPNANLGFVGVPCQIQGLRRLMTSPLGRKKLGEHVKLAIGLFCMDSFKYNQLFQEFVKTKNQISLEQIDKVDIKNNQFNLFAGEKVLMDLPVKDLKPYELPACKNCQDFSAELSDISIGAVGSPKGWTTVLVRTSFGEEVFHSAIEAGVIESKPLNNMEPGISLVSKLSKLKKSRPATYVKSKLGPAKE